jgi:hypothetical protein
MMWCGKQNIVRVLERDPRSYTQIESVLFRTTEFERSRHSEPDRLDDAAERLFHGILEGYGPWDAPPRTTVQVRRSSRALVVRPTDR